MKKPPSLYAQTVAHLCISGGEGALRRARGWGDVWRKARCGGGMRMGVEGCKYAQTWAGLRCGGGMGVVGRRRWCVAVGRRDAGGRWRGRSIQAFCYLCTK